MFTDKAFAGGNMTRVCLLGAVQVRKIRFGSKYCRLNTYHVTLANGSVTSEEIRDWCTEYFESCAGRILVETLQQHVVHSERESRLQPM